MVLTNISLFMSLISAFQSFLYLLLTCGPYALAWEDAATANAHHWIYILGITVLHMLLLGEDAATADVLSLDLHHWDYRVRSDLLYDVRLCQVRVRLCIFVKSV